MKKEERMKNIEEDCQDLADRISYKEKRIRACENIADYKRCDKLKEEVSALKRQRRELKAELKRIEKSNYQSKLYYTKKAPAVSETDHQIGQEALHRFHQGVLLLCFEVPVTHYHYCVRPHHSQLGLHKVHHFMAVGQGIL